MVKTRTVNQTLNPSWDESFTFDFNRSLRYATVEVWDGSSHAKPTFMGHAFIPLFHMAAGAIHRKTYSLGKRSHKSHISGQVVMDVFTDLSQHDNSIRLFKEITKIGNLRKDLCGPPVDDAVLGKQAMSLTEKALMNEKKPVAIEKTDEGVQTIDDPASFPQWEERFDEAQGFPYYFNNVTMVSQWEKPTGFDEGKQPPRSRKESQPPIDPHPSLCDIPEDDIEGAKDMEKRNVPMSVAERAEAERKEKEKNEPSPRKMRRQSKLIKLGSSLRMTLTWGGKGGDGEEKAESESAAKEQSPRSPVEAKPMHTPFPSTMPPAETER